MTSNTLEKTRKEIKLTPQKYTLFHSIMTARKEAKKAEEGCLKEAYWNHAFSLSKCYREIYGSNIKQPYEMVVGLDRALADF